MATNLPTDLLRTFVTVVECGNMTKASERLLRGQSAISMQVKRLEDLMQCRLLNRSKQGIALTIEGSQFFQDAIAMLRVNDEICARFLEEDVSGVVRIGAPEDFATVHLPSILSKFTQTYPNATLEVTCELTMELLEDFNKGKLDLALVKQEPGDASVGLQIWREPLVWVSADSVSISKMQTVPLACAPNPCVYRQRAIGALETYGRDWREAYICTSLAGTLAAVRAGLGVAVLPKEMVPNDLRVVNVEKAGLPSLRATEMALIEADNLSKAASKLRDYIVQDLEHHR
jgi:DNA-binding transcriptional LysR family regulator